MRQPMRLHVSPCAAGVACYVFLLHIHDRSLRTYQQPLSQKPGTERICTLTFYVGYELWHLSKNPTCYRSHAKSKPSGVSCTAFQTHAQHSSPLYFCESPLGKVTVASVLLLVYAVVEVTFDERIGFALASKWGHRLEKLDLHDSCGL